MKRSATPPASMTARLPGLAPAIAAAWIGLGRPALPLDAVTAMVRPIIGPLPDTPGNNISAAVRGRIRSTPRARGIR